MTDPAPVGGANLTLPREYVCSRCAYPTGFTGSLRCPECGQDASATDIGSHAERSEDVARWTERDRYATGVRWSLIVGVWTVGATVVARSAILLFVTPIVLSGLVAGSSALGGLVGRMARPDRREYAAITWRRCVWMLHLPWLVLPLCAAVALAVGVIDLWADQTGGGVYGLVVLAGLWVWMLGCLVAFIVWWTKYLNRSTAGGAAMGRAEGAGFILGLVVIGAAALVGLVGGAVAAWGIDSWLGLGSLILD